MIEKRNSDDGIGDADAIEPRRPGPGGGSVRFGLFAGRGGGYLAACTVKKSDFQKKAETTNSEWMEMLAACGINRALIRVAERVGFDAFMEVWAALDEDESALDERRRLYVPLMEATLLRYQRGQLIRKLGACGMKPAQILKALPPRLRMHLSRRTVVRILNGK